MRYSAKSEFNTLLSSFSFKIPSKTFQTWTSGVEASPPTLLPLRSDATTRLPQNGFLRYANFPGAVGPCSSLFRQRLELSRQ